MAVVEWSHPSDRIVIAAAHKARSSQAGNPKRRGALPQYPKGDLDDPLRRGRRPWKETAAAVPSRGKVQKPAACGLPLRRPFRPRVC